MREPGPGIIGAGAGTSRDIPLRLSSFPAIWTRNRAAEFREQRAPIGHFRPNALRLSDAARQGKGWSHGFSRGWSHGFSQVLRYRSPASAVTPTFAVARRQVRFEAVRTQLGSTETVQPPGPSGITFHVSRITSHAYHFLYSRGWNSTRTQTNSSLPSSMLKLRSHFPASGMRA